MLSEYEALRRWLSIVDSSAVKRLDPQYTLVWKLATNYGASPARLDPYLVLLAKLGAAVGSDAEFRNLPENQRWARIADALGAGPQLRDSTALILNRIVRHLTGGNDDEFLLSEGLEVLITEGGDSLVWA